jgi:hypothetical protein
VVVLADAMPDGWRAWLDWHRAVCLDNRTEIQAVEIDQGEYLGYVGSIGLRDELETARAY